VRVAVIYDFGINKGGGDFVMLNILQALLDAGFDTSLVTSSFNGLNEATGFFNKDLHDIEIEHVKVPRFVKHPYSIAYMAKKAKGKWDFYVFSDDIPKCMSDEKVVCYMHYPHVARFRFKQYVATRYSQTLSGKIVWWIHKRAFKIFYPSNGVPNNWLLIANSRITKNHTLEVFNLEHKRIPVLHPPVASSEIALRLKDGNIRKEDLVVCIGRLEPEKKFEDSIMAVRSLANIRLNIMGFSYDKDYLRKLRRLINKLGLSDRVELLVNADRSTVLEKLLRAKALIHPAPHEPFGIVVVEGMAAGCIPIVRRGFNGPWMEITQEGKYGLGFSSVEELASAIGDAVENYDSYNIEAITLKALEFDEVKFRNRFVNMFESFIKHLTLQAIT